MLGAPEQFSPRSSVERDGDDRIYGTERGTIAHAVLAHMDASGSQANDADTLRRLTEKETEKIELDDANKERYTDKVITLLQKAARSDEWKRVFSSGHFFCEREISAVLGEHFIHGVIDRLYRDSENGWHIVDYKTNHINKSNREELVKNYSVQLDVYAWLVLTLFPDTPRVETHLFFLEEPSLSCHSVIERDHYETLRSRLNKYLIDVVQTQKKPKSAIKNREHCPECGFFVNNACLAD